MKETFSTFLPCFPGFYESPLYYNDMEEQASRNCIEALCEALCEEWDFPMPLLSYFFRNHGLGPSIDLTADFPKFEEDSAKAYCAEIARRLTDILGQGVDEVYIKYEEIRSPKYYNFETDSVNCEITFDSDSAIDYCKAHLADFDRFLIENYRERDGFVPRYSCDFMEWLNRDSWGPHEPGAILQFILQNETPDVEVYASERVQEGVRYEDYFIVPEPVQAFLESPEAKAIGKEYYRLMKQGDDYLEAMGGGVKYRAAVREAKDRVLDTLLADVEKRVACIAENCN